jgi:thiol-disulfide isomerase/thioredoxin
MLSAGQAQADGLDPYPDIGQAPALELEDLAGRPYSLEDLRGQVVLVNFWASWCPPCIIEMPGMQRLKEKLTGRPFTVLAVNVRETPAVIWKFHKLVQVDFPLLLDRDGQAAEDWGIDVYPSSFLIDPQGRIRYAAYGPRQWDAPAIVKTIEALIGTENGDILLFLRPENTDG